MSSRNHRIPVFSSNGAYIVKRLPLKQILAEVALGNIVPNKATSQWRIVLIELEKPENFHISPSTISHLEIYALVGIYGSTAQRIVQNKVSAWPYVFDDKCQTISGGKLHNPAPPAAPKPPKRIRRAKHRHKPH